MPASLSASRPSRRIEKRRVPSRPDLPARRPSRGGDESGATATPKRQRLLESHIGLVHHVARQLARRMGPHVELDELVSAGSLGLIQAADTFDASRGLSFSTFAVPRIRGAILDDLRRQDGVPRNVRRRGRDLARARELLASRMERAPSHDELSAVMSVPAGMIRRWELETENAMPCSLDQPQVSRDDQTSATLGEVLMDQGGLDIEDLMTREREVERLRSAIAGLREQERTVLALSFFEELKLHEIAEVLQLSVCRISQVRTAALARLRVALSDLRAA